MLISLSELVVSDSTGLDAVSPEPQPPTDGLTASGGVINDYTSGSNVYRAHIFTSSGTFDVSAIGDFPVEVEYLVVAGGGGGGRYGGGGGGGLRSTTTTTGGGGSLESVITVSTSPGSYTVTIGGGGGSTSEQTQGLDGGNSVFGPITSTGGGGGGANGPTSETGRPGGSGGGGGVFAPGPYDGGTGTANQGYVGGNGVQGAPYQSVGGGELEEAGTNSPPNGPGGALGDGVQVFISGPPSSTQPVGTPGTNPNGGYFAGGGGGR